MTAAEPVWVIRDDVPIFEAHGDVTAERLERIAANLNRRVAESGDETPVVIGHTRDGEAEHLQPPIVGYADRFKVKPGRRGTPTLFCRWKLYPTTSIDGRDLDAAAVLRQWPRRSVEFLPDDDFIDPISLLGATTPRQDLGLVRCASGGRRVRYAYPAESPGMDLDTFLDALTQLIQQARAAQGGTTPDENPSLPPPGPPPAPVDRAMYKAPAPKERYDAGVAGANATYLPNLADTQREKDRMQHDQNAIRVAQLERELADLKAERDRERRKYQRTAREKDLVQLQAENYQLDREEELGDEETGDGACLSDAAWAKKVDRIRRRYQRAGAKEFIETAKTPEGGTPAQATREQVDRATRLCRTPADYPSVLSKVMNGEA